MYFILNGIKINILRDNSHMASTSGSSYIAVKVHNTNPHPLLGITNFKGNIVYSHGTTNSHVQTLNHLNFRVLGEFNNIQHFEKFSLYQDNNFHGMLKIKKHPNIDSNIKKNVNFHQTLSIEDALTKPDQYITIQKNVSSVDENRLNDEIADLKLQFPGCEIYSNYFDENIPVKFKTIFIKCPLYVLNNFVYVNYSLLSEEFLDIFLNDDISEVLGNNNIRENSAILEFKKTEEGVITNVVLPPRDTFKVQELLEKNKSQLEHYELLHKQCEDDLNFFKSFTFTVNKLLKNE